MQDAFAQGVATETIDIQLKNGQVLSVEMTPVFIHKIRSYFGLFPEDSLDDKQVQEYVHDVLRVAIEKAFCEAGTK